ncbi:MAG TPA: D-alanine--D-alanine ligase [Bacteroides sp.]|nr:D-alanine--D-alanine ligase [Bacteroides sp.]
MKKNIAIVTGGDSSELVISLKSAEQVQQYLDSEKYNSYLVYIREDDWHVRMDVEGNEHIPINKDNFSFQKDGRIIPFDYAFVALHGPPGENGQLQGYLDKLGIPYSTSGVRSLEQSFNKHLCKELLAGSGILTARAVLIRKDENFNPGVILAKVGLPCFIKPNAGGSSFGVSRITRADEFSNAVKKALEEDDEVLVETFIPGTELTCGVLKIPSKEYIFPVTEVISKNEFFDYEAKYTDGMAEEVTPAEIPDELAKQCQSISSRIYDLLDCRGLVRIDFINRDGELYFLELNGVPGMSRESIIPKQIRTLGHTESEIYNLIIRETSGW